MSGFDDVIRAAVSANPRSRATSIDGNVNGADFDAAIRAVSGHGPAPSVHEGNPAATEDQLRAARSAGLPDALADRLTGDDLTTDARTLAAAYTAAGGALVAGTGFDGGARGGGEVSRDPSREVDDAIRATIAVGRMYGRGPVQMP